MIRRGDISVGIVIPPDFERRRIDGREVAQILVDGSDTAVQSAAAQLAQVPIDSAQPDTRAPQVSTPAGGRISVVSFYNPQRRSAVNIVPGLIGVILTMTMVLFTGHRHRARARARQHGTADRHAADQRRTDGRQGAAVRRDRPGADHGDPGAWACGCSACRCAAACWTSIWPRVC